MEGSKAHRISADLVPANVRRRKRSVGSEKQGSSQEGRDVRRRRSPFSICTLAILSHCADLSGPHAADQCGQVAVSRLCREDLRISDQNIRDRIDDPVLGAFLISPGGGGLDRQE